MSTKVNYGAERVKTSLLVFCKAFINTDFELLKWEKLRVRTVYVNVSVQDNLFCAGAALYQARVDGCSSHLYLTQGLLFYN